MKKLLSCFFSLFLVAPGVFGADGAVSRVVPTSQTDVKSQEVTNRGAVARMAVRSDVVDRNSSVNKADVSDGVMARSTVSRVLDVISVAPVVVGADQVQARGAVVSRSVKSVGDARSGLDAAVNTVGRNKRVSDASINSNPAVRRLGVTLRPSTAEVGGRATIGESGVQTGSNMDEQLRTVHSRAAKKDVTAETIAEATTRLEQTATLNKSCQEQYNDCMDQFCAVIDANQGRCSCSTNLARYAKVEEAVKDANNQLNEVAQRIRYVGLSADEIRAILTETEAEEVLSGTKDTTETRNMLEQIEDLIRDPVSNTAVFSESESLGLDMDLDFTSDSVDLFNLDFLGTGANIGSFSNLRGGELYRAAKKRCNTILSQCKEAGSTTSQITGNYDLAIDKDCIAYEKGLKKMNETLVANVGSANRMLQKARLAVLQNKNMYDAKGCIGALEACMTDEMVCGDDYFKCVDPTKKYIDENGKVVLGQRTANMNDFMKTYNNAAINTEFLQNVYEKLTISETNCKSSKNGGSAGGCVTKYLLQKIGTKQKVTDEGLCRAVLDKCQRYTYDSDGKYKPYNDVVVNYVQRAMVNVRAAQSKVIADYASSCIVDVADCYNQQVTQVNSWSSSASISSVQKVLAGACRNVALTCAYAVFKDDASSCPIGSTGTQTCITSISEMFYQSLLCPENSTYQTSGSGGDVNSHCKCNTGYVVFAGACLLMCGDLEERDSYGVCQCVKNASLNDGLCACDTGYVESGTGCIASAG